MTVYKLIHIIIISLFEFLDYERNLVFFYNWNFIYFKSEIHTRLLIWHSKSIVLLFFPNSNSTSIFILFLKATRNIRILKVSFFLNWFCYSFQINNLLHSSVFFFFESFNYLLTFYKNSLKYNIINFIDKLQPHNQQEGN